MNRYLALWLLMPLLMAATPRAMAAHPTYLEVRDKNGNIFVYDKQTGRSYQTNDPIALISDLRKRKLINGFGGNLTQKQFQAPPPKPSEQIAAKAQVVTRPLMQDVRRVPGSGLVTQPLQRLFSAMGFHGPQRR